MILKIANRKFDYFNQFSLQMRFDAVASTFGFLAYFDPENEEHKTLLKPLRYQRAVVEHNNETLITGTILSHSFKDSATKSLVSISGYSVPGILEDCEPPADVALESAGLNLKELAEKFLKPFNISFTWSKSVEDKMNETYDTTECKATQKVKAYLAELAAQKNIILTHTSGGALLFTRAQADLKPVQHFERGAPGVDFSLSINGQAMHSDIRVVKQADITAGNAGDEVIKNALVPVYRPHTVEQSSGTDIDTLTAAKNIRAEELKNIKLSITTNTDKWLNSEKTIRPNMIISVTDPELFLYKKVNWFVESVKLDKTSEKDTAVIECVLPQVYNGNDPVNIFT